MTGKELEYKYWKYYLMLEERFIESLEYVALDKKNFQTFSDGYALLIQSIGAELDAVFKEFGQSCLNMPKKIRSIKGYADYILPNKAEIKKKIIVLGYDIKIQPFEFWERGEDSADSLEWWHAFSKVKHNRYKVREMATQENTLNILGALYLLENMYLKDVTENTEEADIFRDISKLFEIENWRTRTLPWRNIRIDIDKHSKSTK